MLMSLSTVAYVLEEALAECSSPILMRMVDAGPKRVGSAELIDGPVKLDFDRHGVCRRAARTFVVMDSAFEFAGDGDSLYACAGVADGVHWKAEPLARAEMLDRAIKAAMAASDWVRVARACRCRLALPAAAAA